MCTEKNNAKGRKGHLHINLYKRYLWTETHLSTPARHASKSETPRVKIASPTPSSKSSPNSVKISSTPPMLARTDQVGIMENPPPPPARFEDPPLAVDRFGAFLLELAAPLPDAFDPAPLA
jgi:hypothetical protein